NTPTKQRFAVAFDRYTHANAVPLSNCPGNSAFPAARATPASTHSRNSSTRGVALPPDTKSPWPCSLPKNESGGRTDTSAIGPGDHPRTRDLAEHFLRERQRPPLGPHVETEEGALRGELPGRHQGAPVPGRLRIRDDGVGGVEEPEEPEITVADDLLVQGVPASDAHPGSGRLGVLRRPRRGDPLLRRVLVHMLDAVDGQTDLRHVRAHGVQVHLEGEARLAGPFGEELVGHQRRAAEAVRQEGAFEAHPRVEAPRGRE